MIDRCQNTKFFFGPIKNSVFFRDCDNCEIHTACNQFRWRDLTNSVVYLFCETEPVIESSNNLTFAPYNVAYPLQDKHAEATELDVNENKWDMIFDFTDTNTNGVKVNVSFHLFPSLPYITNKYRTTLCLTQRYLRRLKCQLKDLMTQTQS